MRTTHTIAIPAKDRARHLTRLTKWAGLSYDFAGTVTSARWSGHKVMTSDGTLIVHLLLNAATRQRRNVRVTFANGDTLQTAVSGTQAEVIAYYLDNEFNLGTGGRDDMQKAIDVEFLSLS
jgi:hypothetical protein